MPETNSNTSESGAECSSEMTSANKKERTSYEQKHNHCQDGAPEQHKHEDSIKSSSNVNDIDDGVPYSSNEFRFKAHSDINELSIDHRPSKSLFVFGGRDNNKQLSNEQTSALSNNVGIDTICTHFDNVAISSVDKLFQDPPPREDCPICMLPLPYSLFACGVHTGYQFCCGKTICGGCVMAAEIQVKKGKMKDCCAFCREPPAKSGKEMLKRCKKRIKLNDSEAFYSLGVQYSLGGWGLPLNRKKAMELWNQAAEFGSLEAHCTMAAMYYQGRGVQKNKVKAIHHWKIAAIGGHEQARFNLGVMEHDNGNFDLATKHYIIAARAGYEESLKNVMDMYKRGYVMKDEYASALRSYQNTVDEMKSEQRTNAANPEVHRRMIVNRGLK